MSAEIYLHFLSPTDFLEGLFFGIIGLLTVGTLIALKIYANEKSWKKAWENDTTTLLDDLDADHGSVYDLSAVVASKPETLAAVLPGILLVLGLLGTFLGVGVSLNQATEVLSVKGADPVEMISRMMPMLKGMGLTFKTSIYGVLGFLIFKLAYGWWGLENTRIRWVIVQSKPQIFKRNEDLHEREESRHQRLELVLQDQTKSILGQLELNKSAGDRWFENVKTQLESMATQISETTLNELTQSREKSSRDVSSLIGEFKNQNVLSENQTQGLLAAMQSSEKKLRGLFTTEFEKTRDTSAKKIDQLIATTTNGTELTTVVINKLDQLITTTESGTEKTAKSADKMKDVVQELKSTIDEFGPQMTKTSQTMDQATNKIATSSQELKTSIDAFGPMVKDSLDSIRSNFVNTIKKSSAEMSDKMSKSSAEMSKKMSESANKISAGVTDMAKVNKSGYEKLQKSLDHSDEKMTRIAARITGSSDVLAKSSNMTEITIGELSAKISERLKSISTSNLHMSETSKNVDKSLKSNEKVLTEIKMSLDQKLNTLENNLGHHLNTLTAQNKGFIERTNEFNERVNAHSEKSHKLNSEFNKSVTQYGDSITNHLKIIAETAIPISSKENTPPVPKKRGRRN